jgi:ABC-type sugar transport system ATPase subunit
LQDIFAVADRIVVMRRGHKVGDVPASEVTDDDLVAMMVGST